MHEVVAAHEYANGVDDVLAVLDVLVFGQQLGQVDCVGGVGW